MSWLRRRLTRAGSTIAVLLGVAGTMTALGGASPASALAAECTAGTFTGTGSALQSVAQKEIWIPSFCSAGSTLRYTPSYTSSGSGPGLLAWRFTGGATAIETSYQFIGTDDAPTAAQISHARESAGNAQVVVVPVAQTAISIVVNPPANCTVTRITNAQLEEVFRGKKETWEGIGAGAGCTGTITRVVRSEGSGTTFQFKNYLNAINGGVLCGGKTWAQTEPIVGSGGPNVEWPECGKMAPETASGSGAVAETVKSMSGRIGYAALPDVKARGASAIEVQNGISGGKNTFAPPGTEEAEGKGNANCKNALYDVPAQAQTTGTGLDVDWSGVFGGNPTIGSGYSICALTYILAWDNYVTAGFVTEEAETTGVNVKEYAQVIVEGSLGTSKRWYAALPEAAEATRNVADAAKYAAGQIGKGGTGLHSYRCRKVDAGTGIYNDSTCSELAGTSEWIRETL